MRLLEIAVAVTVALTVLGGCRDDPSSLERARRVVESDGRFDTAIEAGEAFVDVAELLRDAALLEASAYAQVAAVEVLRCTQPAIHEARQDVLELLAALEAGEQAPPLPALPECA